MCFIQKLLPFFAPSLCHCYAYSFVFPLSTLPKQLSLSLLPPNQFANFALLSSPSLSHIAHKYCQFYFASTFSHLSSSPHPPVLQMSQLAPNHPPTFNHSSTTNLYSPHPQSKIPKTLHVNNHLNTQKSLMQDFPLHTFPPPPLSPLLAHGQISSPLSQHITANIYPITIIQ